MLDCNHESSSGLEVGRWSCRTLKGKSEDDHGKGGGEPSARIDERRSTGTHEQHIGNGVLGSRGDELLAAYRRGMLGLTNSTPGKVCWGLVAVRPMQCRPGLMNSTLVMVLLGLRGSDAKAGPLENEILLVVMDAT